MNNKSRQRSYKQIAKIVGELAEGYDTVQIFLTKHTDKGSNSEDTESIYYGVGNKFAIYGQIRTWMLIEDQKLKNIADLEFDLDNGGEEGEDEEE